MDWRLLLETARAQRIAALCYAALQQLGPGAVPEEVMAMFRADALALAARNLQLVASLTEITEGAHRLGITLVPYKGPVLAEMAYRNLGLREFVDLDFILSHSQLNAAWKLLESLGYRARNPALAEAGAPIPGEYVFRREKTAFRWNCIPNARCAIFLQRPISRRSSSRADRSRWLDGASGRFREKIR